MPTKQHPERKSAAKPIFDEKGYPRGKTQNETGEAVEVIVFVPWGALSTLSTSSTDAVINAASDKKQVTLQETF